MGASKRKKANAFPEEMISKWEGRDCVDFAVALARLTGWLLHVDWLAESRGGQRVKGDERTMIPLRVYVGDDCQQIFDIRGVKSIYEFSQSISKGLAKQRTPIAFRQCGVATRTYDESDLGQIPLRFQPDEGLVKEALDAIEGHPTYLSKVPRRSDPIMPAKLAADFSFGRCVIFAKALEDLTGVEAVALCAKELDPQWQVNVGTNGFVHSFCLHSDGAGEDSWGRQSVERIAQRYGVVEWRLNREAHLNAVRNMTRNSPDLWQQFYDKALSALAPFYGHQGVDQAVGI